MIKRAASRTYLCIFPEPGVAGDRDLCNTESSQEELSGTGLIDLDTQSTEEICSGFGDAERLISVNVNDLMTLLTHVATVTGMKAAFYHSRRGGMLAGGGAFLGGLLGGPPGIFVGGAVGGWIGWLTSEDFKSVPQILMELPAAEKQKLCAKTLDVVKNLEWTDAAQLVKLVMSNSTIRGQVLGVLGDFLTKVLKAKVKYGN
ncbi:protein C19orf12 homolog [Lonchura striata]